jgi:branched-chain amino acid transport system ATP-binding protein
VSALLEVEDLHVSYGAIEAVKGISFTVDEGQVVTLIGGNGAGKTTTLRTLSGLLKPTQGEVRFAGRNITGLPGHEVLRLGIAHAPEGRRIFGRMSIQENLDLGAYARSDGDVAKDLDRVFELFPVLGERRGQNAGVLSGGEQQMLAIGRALMGRPRVLLLDEPSLGLAPLLVQEIFREIARINREDGTTILLVEQNAQAALSLADHGYVIETGRIVLDGPGAELLHDEGVRKAYLGED